MHLPEANSPSLRLTHPTPSEKEATWTLNSANWGTALGTEAYLEREAYLTTVPLAKDGGVTHWILVDRTSAPNSRPILSSVESLRKRVLVRSKDGKVRESITHGIGSVFCNPAYRGKGYASRMLSELGPKLQYWQCDEKVLGRDQCAFSILYSDIGKKYYAKHGWLPFPSTHISFPPSSSNAIETAKRLQSSDLEALCALDEKYIRKELEQAKDEKIHVALLPDHETMQWHHLREDFMTKEILGRSPTTRGAVDGEPGKRVWAIWTRSYYGPVENAESGNVLHFLRLVIEDEEDEDNAKRLRGIVEIAQKEAEEWKLRGVEIWNPTTTAKKLVERIGLKCSEVEREDESIASLMWYGEGYGNVGEIEWIGNEKYGWC